MTAKISINDYYNPKAILVKQKNIFENSTNEYLVYKIIPSLNNRKNFIVTETKVKLGRNSKNKIEIIKGLDPGDIIIQEGNRMVKNNQIVRIENKNSN